MTYEEKGQWVYLIAVLVGTAGYGIFLAIQAPSTGLAGVDYVGALLGAIGFAIVFSIAGRIVLEIISQSEVQKADIRDRDIDRRGEYVGGIVLGVGMILPFGLALADMASFWIANAMYAAFATAAVVSTSVKLASYRRGF